MKILHVDDDQPIHGFGLWLTYEMGYEIKTAVNTAVAFAILETWQPDGIILDLIMPDPKTGLLEYELPLGVIAAQLLNEMYPHIPLLIYSGHYQHFPQLQYLLKRTTAGFGYLLKGKPNNVIWERLQQVCRGEMYEDPELARHIARHHALYPDDPQFLKNIKQAAREYDALTLAEKEILASVAQAQSSQEIGLKRVTSHKTVNQQVSKIGKKLHLNNSGNTRVLLALLYWYLHHPNNNAL